MKEVTCWYKVDGKGSSEFNHLQNGWVSDDKPTPKFDSQKGWLKSNWIKTLCYLNKNNKVVDKHG